VGWGDIWGAYIYGESREGLHALLQQTGQHRRLWQATSAAPDHPKPSCAHLLRVLRACVKHVKLGLQAGGHKLVHFDVWAVELHPAHPVFDVGLPPHLVGGGGWCAIEGVG